MKKHWMTLIFVSSCFSVFAQDKWDLALEELDRQNGEMLITDEEWYDLIQKKAGIIPLDLKAWHERTSKMTSSENRGITLRFEKDFLRVAENGNVYRKMVLENDSDQPLTINRIDATIGGITEYFFLEGEWIKYRSNGSSSCGNSYFTQILDPHSQIEFELDNGGLINGSKKVPYKIVYINGTNAYESNVIKVRLYKNQITRLKEEYSSSLSLR